MSPKVRIYTTKICGYCVRAKRLFADKGVPFEEVDVTLDHATRRWLVEATGMRTVPQIFIGERACGGYVDVLALERSGELDALLASLSPPA